MLSGSRDIRGSRLRYEGTSVAHMQVPFPELKRGRLCWILVERLRSNKFGISIADVRQPTLQVRCCTERLDPAPDQAGYHTRRCTPFSWLMELSSVVVHHSQTPSTMISFKSGSLITCFAITALSVQASAAFD